MKAKNQDQYSYLPHDRFTTLLINCNDEYADTPKEPHNWPIFISHDFMSDILSKLTEFEFNILSTYHDSNFNGMRSALIEQYNLQAIEDIVTIIVTHEEFHSLYFEPTNNLPMPSM